MLYVFLVDTGTMMTFEMKLALKSVATLKEMISRATHIPPEKQVLLVSGGESLEEGAKVCSYSAGTDTNPLFLFSKSTIESANPPSPSIDYGSDSDLKDTVEGCLHMPPTYNTVVSRCQLAQQFCESAREVMSICEHLVHDQHLQHQGWAAVVANLEDITSAFRNRADLFQHNFHTFLQARHEYVHMLQNFSEDMVLLSKIPVLSSLLDREQESKALLDGNEEPLPPVQEPQQLELQATSQMSLLQWIASTDSNSSLEQLAELCIRGLQQFNGTIFDVLQQEVGDALKAADAPLMKEIRGLEDRLSGLEGMMFEARKIVQEQGELAQAFQQNQNRASNLGDASILPDLCASHRHQLLVMLKNHQQLRDIRRRCVVAKEELSTNLHARLRWIMFVEKMMCDVSSKLVISHENLKRLRHHLEVVQQIHASPGMYISAVAEVVRRRAFSSAFLKWGARLSSKWQLLQQQEVATRQTFSAQFKGHFLATLFPGMDDLPSLFACQPPSQFDSQLPPVSLEELREMQAHLPGPLTGIMLPDVEGYEAMFCSMQEEVVKEAAAEAEELQGDTDGVKSGVKEEEAKAGPTREEKDLESETDTEEFEKVGQSPVEATTFTDESTTTVPVSTDLIKKSAPPPEEVRSSPNLYNSPEPIPSNNESGESGESAANSQSEFLTADFYIDESMPSSYSESNGGGFGGGCGCIGGEELQQQEHQRVRTHHHHRMHWEALQELTVAREELGHLRTRLQGVQQLEEQRATTLRGGLSSLKDQIRGDQAEYCHYISDLSQKLISVIAYIQEQVLQEQDVAVCEAQEKLRSEHQLLLEECRRAMETEGGHLAQVQREAESLQAKHDEVQAELERVRREREESRLKMEAHWSSELQHQREALNQEREEMVKRLTLEHEIELELARQEGQQEASQKEEDLRLLRRALQEKECGRCRELQALMEKERAEAEERRVKEVKEAEERLQRQMRSEMDGLRARFRLVTTVDRSPSEASLDKVEFGTQRSDVMDVATHETIVARMNETFAVEKEQAVQEAVASASMSQGSSPSEAVARQVAFNEALQKATSQKTQQVEEMERKVRRLEAEKLWLLQERWDHNRRRGCVGIGGGSGMIEGGGDRSVYTSALGESSQGQSVLIGTSAIGAFMADSVSSSRHNKHKRRSLPLDRLPQAAVSLVQRGEVIVSRCTVGSTVLVYWDREYFNYAVYCEGDTMYFVHNDSFETLGLQEWGSPCPETLFTTGEVVEKEYCQARKALNRYNVPQGTKFYRVKLKREEGAEMKDGMTVMSESTATLQA